MKKLLLGLFLMGTIAQGASYLPVSGTYTNGGIKMLLTNACSVSSITIANSSASDTVTATFYDNSYATNVWTNTAYVYAISYLTNLSATTYTNAEGIITTNTYTNVLWSTVATNAGSSNITCATVYTVTVPISSTVTASGTWDFAKGVVFNLDTNATVTLYYRRFH